MKYSFVILKLFVGSGPVDLIVTRVNRYLVYLVGSTCMSERVDAVYKQ